MMGMLAYVSTLLSKLGLPHSPAWAGNGGRGRGSPRLPSTEVIRAVSSPHTKAPEPMRISMSNEKPVPNRFGPRKPRARAWPIAMPRRSTASGYSART